MRSRLLLSGAAQGRLEGVLESPDWAKLQATLDSSVQLVKRDVEQRGIDGGELGRLRIDRDNLGG